MRIASSPFLRIAGLFPVFSIHNLLSAVPIRITASLINSHAARPNAHRLHWLTVQCPFRSTLIRLGPARIASNPDLRYSPLNLHCALPFQIDAFPAMLNQINAAQLVTNSRLVRSLHFQFPATPLSAHSPRLTSLTGLYCSLPAQLSPCPIQGLSIWFQTSALLIISIPARRESTPFQPHSFPFHSRTGPFDALPCRRDSIHFPRPAVRCVTHPSHRWSALFRFAARHPCPVPFLSTALRL